MEKMKVKLGGWGQGRAEGEMMEDREGITSKREQGEDVFVFVCVGGGALPAGAPT